jgi:hypothetical protein
MSPLPLPIRIAAGLAAIALERARKLPQDVTEWPMTAVSSALQLSMRVQQRITELAIKGDEALAGLREPDDNPPWAVFDEDLPTPTYLRPERSAFDSTPDAWAEAEAEAELDIAEFDDLEIEADPLEVDVLGTELDAVGGPEEAPGPAEVVPTPVDGSTETPNSPTRNGGHADKVPGALPAYPELSLASVRARLRVLSVSDLEELLEYERGHADRPDFVRMLSNRIATVRRDT